MSLEWVVVEVVTLPITIMEVVVTKGRCTVTNLVELEVQVGVVQVQEQVQVLQEVQIQVQVGVVVITTLQMVVMVGMVW